MKISRLFQKLEYFDSIDTMPIYNWFKLQESNDLGFLLKKKISTTKRDIEILKEVLKKITNEYIDAFGVSDQYKNILQLQSEIRQKEIDFVLTKHRINKTFINVLKGKLKAALESNQRSDTSTVAWVHAKKYMGGSLDMKTTSVREFYSILNEFKKEVEASQE